MIVNYAMTQIPEMDFKNKRRAVAPIIATLLMVAIAVVGGILIFVFAQGFFTDINVGAPTIELVEVFGYDARDGVELTMQDGAQLTLNIAQVAAAGDTKTAGVLGDGDAITIHIRNRGNQAVIIEKVKLYGATYTQGDTPTCGTANPAQGDFLMMTEASIDDGPAALADCTLDSVVGANEEATIIVRYDFDLNNDQQIKIGRPIPIVIGTGNGGTFTKQLQNGVRL